MPTILSINLEFAELEKRDDAFIAAELRKTGEAAAQHIESFGMLAIDEEIELHGTKACLFRSE